MDALIASCVYSFGAQRRIPLRASEASFDMGEYQSSVGELVKTKNTGKIKGERSEFILPLIIPVSLLEFRLDGGYSSRGRGSSCSFQLVFIECHFKSFLGGGGVATTTTPLSSRVQKKRKKWVET